MKTSRSLSIAIVPSLLLMACGGDRIEREKKNYEVVPEGSAAGVTSTIHAPGEVAPAPALTGTNSDTTTAFTLGVPVTDTTMTGGTLAGTMPPMTSGSSAPYSGSQPRRPAPTQPREGSPQPSPTNEQPAEEGEPVPEIPTDSAETQPATETTAPQSEQEQPESEERQKQPEPQPPPPPAWPTAHSPGR